MQNNGLGLIKIEDGKVIVTNPEEGKLAARILPSKDVEVIVDNKIVTAPMEVLKENQIQINVKSEEKPQRKLNLNVSEDKLEARVTIKSEKSLIYKVKNCEFSPILKPTIEVEAEITAPRYTEVELNAKLSELGIIYGLDAEAISYCCKNDVVDNVTIANGKEVIQPIDDEIKPYFNVLEEKRLIEDDNGRVDFKSIGDVETVEAGQLIGELRKGKEGSIGFNVFGQVIKPQRRKTQTIRAGNGTNISENKVYATISGKPYLRGNSFCVEEVFSVNGDVDISKGNIRFIGDVIVHGNVRDDMKVESGNNISIYGNVLRGTLTSEGNVEVKGNIISSNVIGGNVGENYSAYLEQIEQFYEKIYNICENIKKINHRNLMTTHINEKELISAVIDARFKTFNKDVRKLLHSIEKQKDIQCEVYKALELKMKKSYFLIFENINEITKIEKLLREKLESLKSKIYKRCDLYIEYAQDCNINITGSVYVDGKGIYKSNVNSMDSIYFINDTSMIRGGCIIAENEIKAKIVGTPNGVNTLLKVKNNGHIYATMAYYNTKFIIGSKEYILDEPSRDIHVYLDKYNEICVEKLKL
ncbi:MAG: DUF342 domain-containing protein [Clostridium sp.]